MPQDGGAKKRAILLEEYNFSEELDKRQYYFPPVTITGQRPRPRPTIKPQDGVAKRQALQRRDGISEVPTVTIIVKPTEIPVTLTQLPDAARLKTYLMSRGGGKFQKIPILLSK